MDNSRTYKWKDHFDTRVYLNTFYNREQFNNPDFFLRDYWEGTIGTYHKIFYDGEYFGNVAT